MWEDMLQMKEYDTSIKGLEDVRLYVDHNKLKYVATNKSYHPGNKIRIMTGDYNDTMAMFETGTVLEPPTDTGCEKNWIPTGNNEFIYKWSPYELGKVENNQLKIVKTIKNTKLPKNIRGSTVPTKMDDGTYVCVVHYCEHGHQGLEYYHMLLKLNRDFEPVAWSDVFYFNKIGIQYCIGYTVKNNNMYFWFSEHDANPGLVIVGLS
jgi:hypothetical protein